MKKLFSAIIFLALTVGALCAFTLSAAAAQIFVSVEYAGGMHLTLEVEPTDRIEDIKAKIEDEIELEASQQVLVYNGKVLEDGNTLEDYSVQKDSIISLRKRCGVNQHSMTEATCTLPKICTLCGVIYGEALGHSMNDATCVLPKTCSVCGATEGEALGHSMNDATCVLPKTCSVCGATEGEALGHSMNDATCVLPKTCSVCGETEGEALGHSWSSEIYVGDDKCGVCGIERSDFALDLNISIDFGDMKLDQSLKAEPTDTVMQLKNVIAQFLGIPAEEQIMFLGEAVLDDEKLLSEYELSDGSVLTLRSVCHQNGHKWKDATCTTPKTCTVCGTTDGSTEGHVWTEATCTLPKTCTACGETEGFSAGHRYTEADCVSPKICSVCNEASGSALGHLYDGDCDGECNRCGAERQRAECMDFDEDRVCDVCGAETELENSLVGITGAVAIAVAVLAVCAFVVIIALKKKK